MKILAIVAAAIFALTGVAGAAQVDITNIGGTWANTSGGAVNALNGDGTSVMSWGASANSSGAVSSYVFTPEATPLLDVSSPFVLGQFTHNNFAIFGPSITSADLGVAVSGAVDGDAFSLSSLFSFSHNETPNSGTCDPAGSPACPDVVTLLGVSSVGDTVTVNGVEVALNIAGFSLNADGSNPFSSFITNEGQANSAYLVGEFVEVPQIPLPAGMVLMLSGLGIMGGFSAFQKRRKA